MAFTAVSYTHITDEDIQALAFECFAQRLLSLFGRKVWQQVGYAEEWVVLIFTDGEDVYKRQVLPSQGIP